MNVDERRTFDTVLIQEDKYALLLPCICVRQRGCDAMFRFTGRVLLPPIPINKSLFSHAYQIFQEGNNKNIFDLLSQRYTHTKKKKNRHQSEGLSNYAEIIFYINKIIVFP